MGLLNICLGKKVGCTNIQAQKQCGINKPFYGNLFTRFSSESKVTLKSKNFYQSIEYLLSILDGINMSQVEIEDYRELKKEVLPIYIKFKNNKISKISIINFISKNIT